MAGDDVAIASERLDLVLLSPGFLTAVVAGDLAGAQRTQTFALPDGWLESSATQYLGLRLV